MSVIRQGIQKISFVHQLPFFLVKFSLDPKMILNGHYKQEQQQVICLHFGSEMKIHRKNKMLKDAMPNLSNYWFSSNILLPQPQLPPQHRLLPQLLHHRKVLC